MANNIPEKHMEVLKFLDKKLKNTNWALIGSANLALQGINVKPGDIDILASKKDIKKMEKILKDFVVEPLHYKESEKMRSFFLVCEINGVKVEVMDDLEIKVSGSWQNTSDLSAKKIVETNGVKIPGMSLERELKAYSKMGRKKRVQMIKEFLERND